jgi:predicted MFS family arabinose efflux permease
MNPWKGLKNIPHNVWLLAIAALINRAGTMVFPFLAIYLIKEIGFTAGQAGLVITVYGFGGLITAPIIGKLSDRLGALRVMKGSLFLTGIMLFGFSFLTNLYVILVYTFFWSIIGEAFRPANMSLISMETESSQRKIAFTLNRLAVNLGMSIGPVIGGFLSTISFHLLFYVDGITSILAVLFLTFSHFHERREGLENGKGKMENVVEENNSADRLNILHDKRFLLFVISLLPATIVFFQHIGSVPIYLIRELGFKETFYGFMMSVNTGLIIFIEVPLNNAMSNWDDKKAIALGALLCGIGFGLLAYCTTAFLIILTVVIWTFGEMVFFPAAASYVSKISPEKQSGEYMGYFQMTFSFSLMLGPWFGNEILDIFGPVTLWLGAFAFSLITSFMMLTFGKTRKAPILPE